MNKYMLSRKEIQERDQRYANALLAKLFAKEIAFAFLYLSLGFLSVMIYNAII